MTTKSQIEEALEKMEPKAFLDTDWLHSGSTMLNLALSGHPDRGFAKGCYFFYVGESSSGKTFFTLTALAEAAMNKNFDNYDLYYNDIEGGAKMDIEQYFGKRLRSRLNHLGPGDCSETIEEMYFWLDDLNKKKKPFIGIVDSLDALHTKYADKKFQELKEKGDKAKGDFGDGKAKINSQQIRRVVNQIRQSGSILIFIAQERDNMDAGLFEPDSVFSGGRAIKFYATAQIWTNQAGSLKKTINDKPREIGKNIRIAVKKNRLTGKEWTVKAPIYFSHGVDDIGSMVDFLIDEKHWKKGKKKGEENEDEGSGSGITAHDLNGISGTRDQIIKRIEIGDLQDELKQIVTRVWRGIEEKCQIQREKKYE